jgi:hypothetical protein
MGWFALSNTAILLMNVGVDVWLLIVDSKGDLWKPIVA